MLDKSVPYAGLFMRREPGTPLASFPLPDGYKFSFYSEGCAADWARIETSVLEFSNEFAALMHFNEKFSPHAGELSRRCLFIENSDGKKVATSTAWWSDVEGQRRPWLHWVAVDPAYQGLALGKALISRVTQLMFDLEGDVDFYLGTQTWSYKAISIYKMCGYAPTNEKILYNARHDNYRKALRILKRLERKRMKR